MHNDLRHAMYLQSLEIIGFKSFASKTKIEFHRGVTAVVGPNGCGKSNVLDSIRWVLGEQSAKALRGGEMADVIFSGTDSRPALGMAEVSLTFSECEQELGLAYSEVCITRRVFRDGQSEYFLNKVPCRLRDIHQLFMDTGIGRSAYSIMEQGKLDQILSSRPEDRRAIFEEAAGITKYKAQKKEAMRKLEATEANLIRAEDILKEVQRQIGSLQRQANKARRYQALLTDARVLDTHQSHRQHAQFLAQQRTVREQAERVRIELELREHGVTTKEGEVAEQRLELEVMEERLTAARQAVNELRNRISQGESRLGFNEERLAEFSSLAERYERDIAAAREKISIQQSQLEDTDLELEAIQLTMHDEARDLEQRQAGVQALTARRVEAERAHQQSFHAITRIESRLSALRNEIAGSISARDGAEARLGILSAEIEKLGGTSETLSAQAAELNAQLNNEQQTLEAQRSLAGAAEEELRSLRTQLSQVDKSLHAESRALSERSSKLEVLRQLNAEGEGFGKGTQAVLKGLDNPEFYKPSVAGALAQFIEVEREWITPIEAAFGANLQAVVMKDSMVAEAALKTLANKPLGRASLALRDFVPAAEESSAPLPDRAICWAAEKVKCTPEVETLVRRLLAGVALAANVETALAMLANGGARQFVTLGGEIVSSDGIATGGSINAKDSGSSVLQRKNQIADLAKEATEIQSRVDALTLQRAEISAQLESGQASLQEAREETQRIQMKVAHLRGQSSAVEKEATEARRRTETIGWERETIAKRHAEALARLGHLEQEAYQAAKDVSQLQEEQATLQAELASLREAENEVALELNELRVRVATERQRHQSLQSQRQPMAVRLAELQELIGQRQRDIEDYRARSTTLVENSGNIEAGIAQARGKLDEAEEGVEALLGERAQMIASVEDQEISLRETRHALAAAQEQRGQCEVKDTQLQMRIESVLEHVQRRYQLDIADFSPDLEAVRAAIAKAKSPKVTEAANADEQTVPAEVNPEVEAEPVGEIDWARVESLVHEMTQRLDSMGPINLDAIQEYEELEERHTFLEQQMADLSGSKAELLNVIAKINTTTRKLFADTFEKVRVNFKEMFTELFGGGQANLVMLDESDPLESGIEIIAKPPGKQLQSVMLLSGGEKAMTAVALLFALYMVKPSPFCVLDEIDAPLDESNINRFIRILERFQKQSQFVVISHNKRTIAKADMLYGVTMEEHGVSRVVGVRFGKRDGSKEQDFIGPDGGEVVPSIAESFGKSGLLHSEQVSA